MLEVIDGYLKVLMVNMGRIGEAIKHKAMHSILIFLVCMKTA